MEPSLKREASSDITEPDGKRQKRQWRVPRARAHESSQNRSIQPGDSGIWATCDKGREGKCVGELMDLFTDYAEKMYESSIVKKESDPGDQATDIESDIRAEVNGMHRSRTEGLFTPIRVDVQCGECP